MKCGSCRTINPPSLSRVDDNDLFEILKTLNSERRYNPKYVYFCKECIDSAQIKLSAKESLKISQRDPPSFSVANVTAISTSSSSRDEYDDIIDSRKTYSDTGTPFVLPPRQTKRSMTVPSKPCPKRFKKPLAPAQLTPIPNLSNDVEIESQSSSSSVGDNLFNVRDESNSQSEVENQENPIRESNESNSSHRSKQQTKSSQPNDGTSARTSVVSKKQPAIPSGISGTVISNLENPVSSNISDSDVSNSSSRSKRRTKTPTAVSKRIINPAGTKEKVSAKTSTMKTSTAPTRVVDTKKSKTTNEPQSSVPPVREPLSDRSANVADEVIEVAMAPLPKNPRQRVEVRNLTQYFETPTDVNEYSRNLGG